MKKGSHTLCSAGMQLVGESSGEMELRITMDFDDGESQDSVSGHIYISQEMWWAMAATMGWSEEQYEAKNSMLEVELQETRKRIKELEALNAQGEEVQGAD